MQTTFTCTSFIKFYQLVGKGRKLLRLSLNKENNGGNG